MLNRKVKEKPEEENKCKDPQIVHLRPKTTPLNPCKRNCNVATSPPTAPVPQATTMAAAAATATTTTTTTTTPHRQPVLLQLYIPTFEKHWTMLIPEPNVFYPAAVLQTCPPTNI